MKRKYKPLLANAAVGPGAIGVGDRMTVPSAKALAGCIMIRAENMTVTDAKGRADCNTGLGSVIMAYICGLHHENNGRNKA